MKTLRTYLGARFRATPRRKTPEGVSTSDTDLWGVSHTRHACKLNDKIGQFIGFSSVLHTMRTYHAYIKLVLRRRTNLNNQSKVFALDL